MTATKHHRPHRTASAWWRRLAVAAVVLLAGTACFAGGSDDDGDATAVFTMDDASADEPASEMESMSDEGGFDMADDEMATEKETSLRAAAATEETGTVRLSLNPPIGCWRAWVAGLMPGWGRVGPSGVCWGVWG